MKIILHEGIPFECELSYRRSEDTNRQKEVNGKPEGFRIKNKNPIVEVITKYKYRNESNKAKRAKIN